MDSLTHEHNAYRVSYVQYTSHRTRPRSRASRRHSPSRARRRRVASSSSRASSTVEGMTTMVRSALVADAGARGGGRGTTSAATARGTRARGRGAVVVICGFCVRARSVPFGVVRAFVRRGEDGRARRLSNVSINSVRVSTGRVSCRLGRTARRKPLARPTTVAT